VHREPYPTPVDEWDSPLCEYTTLLIETNGAFWKFKRENNLSLRAGLPEAYVPEQLRPWAEDLRAMHGISKLSFGRPDDDSFAEVKIAESDESVYIRPPSTQA